MFAKIFGQIFDSSIAEDYNCRRMFMDLLVLADPDGAVDMTYEAIARRTNVPLEEVKRYITELQQPDPSSRSKMSNGSRIIPLDSGRDWGWQIVNYQFYRMIRDQEVRRAYFRDAQRRYRKKKKAVKDDGLTPVDTSGHALPSVTSSSSSSSKSRCTKEEAVQYCTSIGLPASDGEAMFLHWQEKGWVKVKDWKLTIQKWKSFGYLPSQKQRPASTTLPLPIVPNWGDRKAQKQMIDEVQEQKNELFRLKQREGRQFTPEEQRKYETLAKRLEQLKAV